MPSNPRTIGTAELLWYEGSFAIFEHATALSVPISYPKRKQAAGYHSNVRQPLTVNIIQKSIAFRIRDNHSDRSAVTS